MAAEAFEDGGTFGDDRAFGGAGAVEDDGAFRGAGAVEDDGAFRGAGAVDDDGWFGNWIGDDAFDEDGWFRDPNFGDEGWMGDGDGPVGDEGLSDGEVQVDGEGADVPVRVGGAVPLPPRSDEVRERWAQEAESDAAAALIGSRPVPVQGGTVATAAGGRQAGTAATAGAAGPVTDLALLVEGAREVAGTDWHELPGRAAHEALDQLEQLERSLAAMRAGLLSAVEADGLWALDGQRTFSSWLRQRTDTSPGSASRQVRTARALRDVLPQARQALQAGTISTEHVGVLVREAIRTERQRAQLTDKELGEEFLVAQAAQMDAGTYSRLVRSWAIAADPEAADRAWREADAKEEVTLAPTLGGYHLAGWLDDLSGQAVATALQAHMGRKGKNDERTPAQRRAAALVALARQALDSGDLQPHSRIRPHLTVTTSWQTFQALVAASGSVVPPLGPGGQPYPAGTAFGISAETTLTALGGPRSAAADQGDLFSLSDEARDWLRRWQPGEDHVIPAAIDHQAMTGVEPATLEDGTPIPPALLARMACDSGLSRVVFGPQSTVLDVGREQRIFPAHMVKAIHARDRNCQAPDCDEPPGFGEIHHALQWYRDQGPTSVDLGLLLCWHHHDWVHTNAITITRAAGKWHFYNRHGWLITPKRDRSD